MNGEKAHENMLSMAVIRKPQSKTTMRHHFTPGRVAVKKYK